MFLFENIKGLALIAASQTNYSPKDDNCLFLPLGKANDLYATYNIEASFEHVPMKSITIENIRQIHTLTQGRIVYFVSPFTVLYEQTNQILFTTSFLSIPVSILG